MAISQIGQAAGKYRAGASLRAQLTPGPISDTFSPKGRAHSRPANRRRSEGQWKNENGHNGGTVGLPGIGF